MHTAEESRMATSHSMASLEKKEPDRSPTPAAVRAGVPSKGPGLALNMQRSTPVGVDWLPLRAREGCLHPPGVPTPCCTPK
jgi:hypothetical protein